MTVDNNAHDFDTLVALDKRIDSIEFSGIEARWDFGRRMLLARDGKGRLADGYLVELVKRTGKSRSELKYRAQFATKYETANELANALASFAEHGILTWHSLTACRFTLPSPGPDLKQLRRLASLLDKAEGTDNGSERQAYLAKAQHLSKKHGINLDTARARMRYGQEAIAAADNANTVAAFDRWYTRMTRQGSGIYSRDRIANYTDETRAHLKNGLMAIVGLLDTVPKRESPKRKAA